MPDPALRLVPFGPPLTLAVGEAVAAAKADDPMAPVTVAVPSAHAVLTLRRALAGRQGLVNVQLLALPQVIELLATPVLAAEGTTVVSPLVRAAAVRRSLEGSPLLGSLADDPDAVQAVARTVADLADVPDDRLHLLSARTSRSAEVVEVVRRTRQRLEGLADEAQVARAARAAVADGALERLGLGTVLVVAPGRLRAGEREVIAALHERGAVQVLVGTSADPVVEAASSVLVEQLAAVLGPPVATGDEPASPAAGLEVLVAPDAEEEVRLAVRRIAREVEGGTPPQRIAMVARSGEPYAQIAHDLLTAAQIPHHGDLPTTRAQSVAGRALLGLLDLDGEDWSRRAVMALLASVPMLDAEGRSAPVQAIDRESRRMGLVAGRDEWAGRSTELREDRLLRLEAARAEGDDDYAARLEGSIARLDQVDAFIEELIGSVEAGERRSWAELAAHAEQLLVRWLGGPRLVARWLDPAEQAHHGAVLDTLARLGQLDSIDPDPGPTRFLATLRAELSQPAGDMGSYGEGVFVGRLASLVAADHDLVVVLGAVAGSVPARGADDALIPDAERAVLGGLVAPRRRSSGEELRDLHAALASAPRRLVTLPRADLRGQRGCLPAPWLLHLLSEATGGQVTSSSFLQLSPPLLRSVASFESSVLGGDPPASVQEHDVVALLAAASTGSTAPLSHPDAVLARGLDAVRARSSGRLGPWSGEVPAAARFDDDHLASATRLERYATCPFSALMAMLGLEERDDPTEIEQLDSRNRGSLVHGVLEDLVGSAIGRPPHQPWDDDDLARVQQALASRRADFEARGLTGRPLLWQLQQEAIDVRLRHWMAADSTRRAEQGLVPDGVEVVFGPDVTPVSVALPDGRRLGFRGMIDRVDRDVEDGRFALYDYKTGYTRSNPFRVLKDDPVGGGRLLQLAIYAEAVRVAKGRPDAEVDAHYWLVDRPKQPELEGDRYGRAEHQRLQEVLGQIVEGMESGAFPRHPGEERAYYRTHEHCSWCPYDRSCPTTRGDDWEVVRGDGRIAQVVHLLEGPPPAEDDDQ